MRGLGVRATCKASTVVSYLLNISYVDNTFFCNMIWVLNSFLFHLRRKCLRKMFSQAAGISFKIIKQRCWIEYKKCGANIGSPVVLFLEIEREGERALYGC